ncbi:hypothetical protein BJ912DRAFT_935468 [Pholiota molesta]|nr:hypothetical protein BJ912DRAFT_935468 [Pholiota molesta]
MYLATQGTMRREGASYDTEAGATHWVQNFILGELKLWVHSFKDNSAEKNWSPIEILTTAEALEQEENEMDIGGKSQREGHLGNGITENLGVTTTKRSRGRPKKNPLPILPFNNAEAGIVTRSHAGKPGLLGKIGEVQSKVAVTKSPVKKDQARPKKPYVDSREKRASSKTIGRPLYDDHNKSEGETEISAPESKEVTPISKRKKEKGSLNSKKANKPPGLSRNHFSEGGGSGEYQLPLIHSIGRYKIEDPHRVEKFFECLRNPKVVVDEEELDKALRDLDIDSPAMQYVFKRYYLIQNDLNSNAVASNDHDRLKFENIYRYLKKLDKRKQTI